MLVIALFVLVKSFRRFYQKKSGTTCYAHRGSITTMNGKPVKLTIPTRRSFSSEIITIVTLTGAVRFNICNNAKNIYTLEDLDNSLKIKQDLALKIRVKFNFIMERYKDAIIDLTK
ncbi:hypothetical protein C2G38_2155165 [Gigaspora rosea]|uniref:Uncharacterized protein n=1 Tax=Gigaspora rosea TaxID=44941 RepID=A0A397WAF0_9GLOM|nr:hypothetical protein C2G38_2155165 [Gigaspora rosea]